MAVTAAMPATAPTSCPVSQRIWSNSCTPMSTTMPPLDAGSRNARDGGDSSHCAQRTIATSPSSPAAIRSRSVRSAGTNRRQYATCSRVGSAAIARVSAVVRPHGFSQSTGSPSSDSAVTTSTWKRVGTQTRAPSTSGRSASVARGASTSAAASSDGSTTHTISTSDDEARARACVRPILPAPTSASRNALM